MISEILFLEVESPCVSEKYPYAPFPLFILQYPYALSGLTARRILEGRHCPGVPPLLVERCSPVAWSSELCRALTTTPTIIISATGAISPNKIQTIQPMSTPRTQPAKRMLTVARMTASKIQNSSKWPKPARALNGISVLKRPPRSSCGRFPSRHGVYMDRFAPLSRAREEMKRVDRAGPHFLDQNGVYLKRYLLGVGFVCVPGNHSSFGADLDRIASRIIDGPSVGAGTLGIQATTLQLGFHAARVKILD